MFTRSLSAFLCLHVPKFPKNAEKCVIFRTSSNWLLLIYVGWGHLETSNPGAQQDLSSNYAGTSLDIVGKGKQALYQGAQLRGANEYIREDGLEAILSSRKAVECFFASKFQSTADRGFALPFWTHHSLASVHTTTRHASPREPFFHPRQGFEDKQGSETFEFYVVIQGHVPGIYTHWEDASVQVIGFKKSVHKKHTGWSAATQAWDAARQPVASPRTPPPLDRKSVKPSTPATPRARVAASTTASTSLSSSASPPSTPSRPKRVLQQASSEMRRGLADGSFRKLEATSSVSNALAHATDSALEVYDISDIESD
ncbi:hypothetical protein B0H14DRAFT_2656891 [Mycena olivaceomarginata]|nr:hypothetical protein B0H14DRAFT_2656891 [Mycena olivaceomarginata]